MTHKGGTAQACAACKFQRRKCSSDCPLAPYFPPDQPKMFQNAHKLFGVKKIIKIIEKLDPPRKQEAMRSIIYQSNMRDRFPVHGCWGIICQLSSQIRQFEEELFAINAQLEMYRSNQNQIPCLDHEDETSQLVLGMAPPSNDQQAGFGHINLQQSYSNASHASNYLESNDCLWFPNQNVNHNLDVGDNYIKNNNNSMPIQPCADQQQLDEDYDEIHHPFIYSMNDRQSYIDQEAYQSSSEESLKETTRCIEQHVADNELKSAAACFSLTSVN